MIEGMDQIRHLNYRFGDFELRTESETLLCNGVPVPIQRLPLLMLTVLLEQPGQIVRRDTLQTRLWGDQDYLQFENGLHVAAAKLREALGDTASAPKFVKTVPRRGYQFVCEDLVVVDPKEASPKPVTYGTETAPDRGFTFLSLPGPRSGVRFRNRDRHTGSRLLLLRSNWIRGAAYLTVLVVALAWIYRIRHDTRVALGQTVMLGSFYNQTNDPHLDGIYDFLFQLKMQESQYIHLTETVDPIQLVGPSGPKSIPDELALCRAAKTSFLLTGLLKKSRKGYAVRLSSWNCSDNRLLTSETAEADDTTTILAALDTAAVDLRLDLGEPKDSPQRLDTPSAQAMSNSIAALRAFHMGDSKRSPRTIDEAISYYRLATDLDPKFALAFDRLGIAYTWVGKSELSKQALSQAFQLRDRTTDHERLRIASHYYNVVTAELPLAVQTYQLWVNMFRDDVDALNSFSALYLENMAQPALALDLENRAIALNPASTATNVNLAEARFELGDSTFADAHCRDLSLPGSAAGAMHMICFRSSFSRGDEDGMQRELDWAKQPINTSRLLNEAAWVAVYRGQLTKARQLFLQARKSSLEGHFSELAAKIQLDQAFLESALGMNVEAKEDALSATNLDPTNPDTRGMAALVLENIGDLPAAEGMEKTSALQAPLDTILNLEILSTAHAVLSLKRHDAQAALQSLNEARPYDFGLKTDLAPAYFRGLALEEQHHWSEAALQFQSVIDHRNILPSSLFVALSKLELGHVLKESGEEAQATAIFEELDHLWSHADDTFEPKHRLSEYERMHRDTPSAPVKKKWEYETALLLPHTPYLPGLCHVRFTGR